MVGFFDTQAEAAAALAAYKAQVQADPDCTVAFEAVQAVQIDAQCATQIPVGEWVFNSSHTSIEQCEEKCPKSENCPKGVCIQVTTDCFCRDCPDNPTEFIPCPCDSTCGEGTYYEWECYQFGPGETIDNWQWAVDEGGFEVDWCKDVYFNAYHFIHMPKEKCPSDADQYWNDASCDYGCLNQDNPLP
jgi:hypothetical protein